MASPSKASQESQTEGKVDTTAESPTSVSRFSTILDSLSYRDFRWIWIGSFVSFMAMNMQMITRSWLILRVTGDSPLALSLVTLTFALPMTVVAPFAGALADRFSRKKLIFFSQAVNAVLTLIVGILDLTGIVTFWHIMIIGVFNGSLMAINMPSRQAIISDIVPENKLMNAISLNHSSMNLTRVAGPALAGFLILLVDTAGVFFIIAGVYVFSALSIVMVNYVRKFEIQEKKSVIADIKEGLTYSFGVPDLRGLFIMTFIPVLFGFSYMALLPAWGREALDIQSDGLGILLMIMGIGATAGTILLAAYSNIKKRGIIMLGACTTWGIVLAICSQVTSFPIAVILLVFIGLTSSVYMAMNMTMIQLKADPRMRGRVMSIGMMSFGMMPLSAVPIGFIAQKIGTPDALMISGLMLATFTIIFGVLNRTFRQLD